MKRAALLVILLWSASVRAQSWQPLASSFLEPNRFSTVKDLNTRALWLEIGYGRDILKTGALATGLEALMWSRLKALSDFRFPVETADYMFGAYATYPTSYGRLRLRLDHISSHRVDGTHDTIIGGPSSRFSREYVSIENASSARLFGVDFKASLGVRYIFHQVTTIEKSFHLLSTVDAALLRAQTGDDEIDVILSGSSAGGPSTPGLAAMLSVRMSSMNSVSSELYLSYYSGFSKAGTDRDLHVNSLEAGIRIMPYLPW